MGTPKSQQCSCASLLHDEAAVVETCQVSCLFVSQMGRKPLLYHAKDQCCTTVAISAQRQHSSRRPIIPCAAALHAGTT
jgi:hypothetical protein